MRIAVYIMLAGSIPLGAFAAWGLWTKAGRSRFDEMDGLYPLGAGVLSVILSVAAAITWVVSRWVTRA